MTADRDQVNRETAASKALVDVATERSALARRVADLCDAVATFHSPGTDTLPAKTLLLIVMEGPPREISVSVSSETAKSLFETELSAELARLEQLDAAIAIAASHLPKVAQ